jgi:hypothetical protein
MIFLVFLALKGAGGILFEIERGPWIWIHGPLSILKSLLVFVCHTVLLFLEDCYLWIQA